MGFLDPKERVLDIVLTDTGKQTLLKGALRISYWVPYDDEVNYQSLEDPLIVEATAGKFGLNNTQEDLTNVKRPMFTAKPGVGHSYPIPSMVVVDTSSLDVSINQEHLFKRQVSRDENGKEISSVLIEGGFRRFVQSESYVSASYSSTGSFFNPDDLSGFLITVYQNVSGNYHEILHNRSSDGNVAYRNDLALRVKT